MTSESEFILPASTVCHCDGLPFELAGDTVIRMHPKSWALIHWRTVNNGRPFRSLEESQAFGRMVEEGKKDVNNSTKPKSDDLDKLSDETNTPAEEAAKRLGCESFNYTERS